MTEPDRVEPHPEYPRPLADAEDVLIRARREAVRDADAGGATVPKGELSSKAASLEGRIGVGLSGGGIRSATFCLGVFQALANADRNGVTGSTGTPGRLIGQIDFLSTVSGGGYFGSFLGRLFTRDWAASPNDVGRVIRGDAATRGPNVFRFLRYNGRYLAPRGSGDVLTMMAVALRNWLAVQVVLLAAALTVFVGLQFAAQAVPQSLVSPIAAHLPSGPIMWSAPWITLIALVAAFVAAPACWGYWVIDQPMVNQGAFFWRRSDLLVLLGCLFWLFRVGVTGSEQTALRILASVAALTTIGSVGADWRAIMQRLRRRRDADDAVNNGDVARRRLAFAFRYAMIVAVGLAVLALLDSLGKTAYIVTSTHTSRAWLKSVMAVAASFAGVAAFGRQILVLFGDRGKKGQPHIGWSVISWVVAGVLLGCWLTFVDAVSWGIMWHFQPPAGGRPQSLQFAGEMLAMLAGLTVAFGNVPTFLNMSTLHAFYASRLTRAYLGATNDTRLDSHDGQVVEVFKGDDIASDKYWDWPKMPAVPTTWSKLKDKAAALFRKTDAAPSASASRPHGCRPLHIVNVTVNETLDAATGVQQQDRKGTGLAIGPAGFSLGVRHHLVAAGGARGLVALPADGHQIFGRLDDDPEQLTLGRWAAISGAAFSSAVGSRTTVPTAILATFANVRLGYWWDSGIAAAGRRIPEWITLPVYRGLFAEAFARLKGTSERLWNLSDGGHFENLGGYELIRRKLPLIILVDAEADPDYTFEGLANLVRKARLDFNAEIEFLPDDELKQLPGGIAPAPFQQRIFGTLEMLRRGRWSEEPVPDPSGTQKSRLTVDVDRGFFSRAHAAIARVTYADGSEPSWLVYVKATLTGDEPADVIEYHGAHPDFPQETTADQFFDEAQWESYRRLGEHIGEDALTAAVFQLVRHKPSRIPAAPMLGGPGPTP